MPRIENIKTIAVGGSLDSGNATLSFSRNLFVDFIPDEIILRKITVVLDSTTTQEAYKLTSSLLPNCDIVTFLPDGGANDSLINEIEDIHFSNSSQIPVRGNYMFYINTVSGSSVNTIVGEVTLLFEFVKYASRKQIY
jgi:hypothetical protein